LERDLQDFNCLFLEDFVSSFSFSFSLFVLGTRLGILFRSRTTNSAVTSQVVLKIFTSEFYSIGALFAIYGAGVLVASLFRRQQGNKQFFSEIGEDGLNRKRFRTSGNVVVVLTALSVAAYACLMGLTFKLGD